MFSTKTILIGILGLNLFAIFLQGFRLKINKRNTSEVHNSSQTDQAIRQDNPYRFDDPLKAYFLLEHLDVFEVINDRLPGADYSNYATGFKINNHYCKAHRADFVDHPEMLFDEINVIATHHPRHKLRSMVLPAIGANDLHPEAHNYNRRLDRTFKVDMRTDASIFFTHNVFFQRRQVGKQFSCLSQASNAIPGHDIMIRKDYFGQALVDYAKAYSSRPSCFNFKKQFPKTWILSREDQCRAFFDEFTSNKYRQLKEERKMVYFRKIGAHVHEGKGVFPVTDEEEVFLKNLYQNGELCGQVRRNYLIQYNVHNLLLVHNRKFGLRMFMLVASTNPLLVYYHDGYARLSLNDYDPKSKDIITFVTNIGMNIKEAEKGTGLTAQQIQESTLWLLEDFQAYLLKHGIISDPNWLDNYLRPELKKTMIHLIRMSRSGFFKRSSVFELYGLDFVMDEQLNLWFIECNRTPLLDGFSRKSTKLLNRMLADTIEIELGLVRSRMKRVINYINQLSAETSHDAFFSSLNERREEFKEVVKNRFEPEFEPRAGNTFHKIVDDRERGTQRYAELIPQSCL